MFLGSLNHLLRDNIIVDDLFMITNGPCNNLCWQSQSCRGYKKNLSKLISTMYGDLLKLWWRNRKPNHARLHQVYLYPKDHLFIHEFWIKFLNCLFTSLTLQQKQGWSLSRPAISLAAHDWLPFSKIIIDGVSSTVLHFLLGILFPSLSSKWTWHVHMSWKHDCTRWKCRSFRLRAYSKQIAPCLCSIAWSAPFLCNPEKIGL